jgi:hypothetical protein
MNINSLANAVKPAVLPGEELAVRVIQEGKEPGQGVGYSIDDGTMIVVEGGARHIDRDLDVAVTRVLQTVAGPDDLRAASARLSGRGGAAGSSTSSCGGGTLGADGRRGQARIEGRRDRPLLAWTLRRFRRRPSVGRMVVVTAGERTAEVAGADWLPAVVTDVVARRRRAARIRSPQVLAALRSGRVGRSSRRPRP